jgi:2-hydroxy-3-keto-5-methylthiopentenyl-1-phosphate phosphatase
MPVAYIGDGYSDRCAAIAADRRFARRFLAQDLDELGLPYTPFDDFHTVREALLAG